MKMRLEFAACFCAFLTPSLAGSLADIKHVVLFMQENRAFDHYYGTLKGVRGFKDPNVLKHDDGKPIWYQKTNLDKAEYLLPFYLNEDKSYAESSQCQYFGSNDWTPNHNAWNNGKIDGWVTGNSEDSWSYYKREDLPVHFSIIDAWTVCDMYQESVMGPTNPNRVTWVSGTINVPGSIPGNHEYNGGPYIENYETDGCEIAANGEKYSCYPLRWKTFPEELEAAGVDWFVYQDHDNFDDNPMAHFAQYQTNNQTDPLILKGNVFAGLDEFYKKAADGTLPPVSWIIGPMELSEHPPNRPKDGASLQYEIVNAVLKSPKYNETALLISYDETGGLGDHVPPFVSPNGTTGEWFTNPEDLSQYVPSGPGFRVPFYIISPWTRGGHVFTAPSDHNSQLLFLEKWLKARYGKDVTLTDMNQWRRQYMSDLVDFFDFENPDLTIPDLVSAPEPDMVGTSYAQPALCEAQYGGKKAVVPYGSQSENSSLYTEDGYKQIRGALTEGRYLVLKDTSAGNCLQGGSNSTTSRMIRNRRRDSTFSLNYGDCGLDYSDEKLRFIVHQQGDTFSKSFKIESAQGGYILNSGYTQDVNSATTFNIAFDASKGYSISSQDSQLFDGKTFLIYSVTYN